MSTRTFSAALPASVPVRSIVVLLLFVTTSEGVAQSIHPPDATSDSATAAAAAGPTSRFAVVGRTTAVVMTGALGAGLVVSMLDSRLLAGSGTVRFAETSALGNMLGGPGPLVLGSTLYVAGRGLGNATIASTGRDVIRAVMISGALTGVTKGVVGRARPIASPGDADEYAPGHGFFGGARSSFPSGHTAAAFSAATVITREIDAAHPRLGWIAGPVLFGAASFVGWSRLYDRQHWPSDVLVGGALGTLTGFEVVAHSRGERAPVVGALVSHLRLEPGHRGLRLGWSLH